MAGGVACEALGGAIQEQVDYLLLMLQTVTTSLDTDRWRWELGVDADFPVKAVRIHLTY